MSDFGVRQPLVATFFGRKRQGAARVSANARHTTIGRNQRSTRKQRCLMTTNDVSQRRKPMQQQEASEKNCIQSGTENGPIFRAWFWPPTERNEQSVSFRCRAHFVAQNLGPETGPPPEKATSGQRRRRRLRRRQQRQRRRRQRQQWGWVWRPRGRPTLGFSWAQKWARKTGHVFVTTKRKGTKTGPGIWAQKLSRQPVLQGCFLRPRGRFF